MNVYQFTHSSNTALADPIPFPANDDNGHSDEDWATEQEAITTAEDVLETFASMSRRITDLARELKCLGYFDDNDDWPRAA